MHKIVVHFRRLVPIAVIAVILVFAAAGCDSESLQSNDLPAGSEKLQIGGFELTELQGDAFAIKSARFIGNQLEMNVYFSGGCADHDFRLYAAEAVTRSIPPQLSVYAVHDGNGDLCEAWLTETLLIDASPLVEWLDTPFIMHLHPVDSTPGSVTVSWDAQ
ncbi:MAG: hypothetical protein O2797_02355 [Bacteroidetes bacterium]|nr:hypothetical protein [Bacteroidota bacterium]MDA1333043.1 hypothetical protein [Bacteroidota bacterium]